MEKNVFISDQFNIWEKCKKRYYFKYIKELNLPEPEADYKYGKSVHALINYYLRGFKTDHLLKNADEKIKNTWDIIKNHPILANKVIATEWTFNSKINNTKYWLNGRIDAVFYDEEQNKYIIADWKTGENIPKNPEYSYQCMIYLYSFFNSYKDLKLNCDLNQDNLIFQYVKISDYVEVFSIPFSEQKEKEYEEILINNIYNMENSSVFPETNPCSVKNCQYKCLCDYVGNTPLTPPSREGS
ncbi:MAG: PD-(D/E)XK nuclease family protein [bacterium]